MLLFVSGFFKCTSQNSEKSRNGLIKEKIDVKQPEMGIYCPKQNYFFVFVFVVLVCLRRGIKRNK